MAPRVRRVFISHNFDDLSSRALRAIKVIKAWQSRELESAERMKVLKLREAFERVLLSAGTEAGSDTVLGGLEVHQRLVEGLPGISLVLAGSLAHETFEDLTDFYGMTAKTLRVRLRQDHLALDESERVLRTTRVTLAASDLFGGFDAAREYLRTKNFSLGGARPIDLIQSAEGERIVLDEIHAHANSAPL